MVLLSLQMPPMPATALSTNSHDASASSRHTAVELDILHWQSLCCAASPACSGLDSIALQACPCTSKALCKADTTGKFRSDCSWNSNTPGYWYFGHGGEPPQSFWKIQLQCGHTDVVLQPKLERFFDGVPHAALRVHDKACYCVLTWACGPSYPMRVSYNSPHCCLQWDPYCARHTTVHIVVFTASLCFSTDCLRY